MAKNNEHQFENDIEELMTTELGWTKASERSYLKWREMGLDLERLTDFIKLTQQNAWRSFERSCGKLDVYRKFYQKFEDAVAAQGLIDVLRNGFRINGRKFFVISFRPENKLNQLDNDNYKKNICQLIRQWHYSEKEPAKSVDVVLSVNGIPLAAIELKNQNCGQSVVQGKNQWMTDRSPSEIVFKPNHRVLVYFAVDLCEAWMTTRLEGLNTRFLPFNRGSAGAGEDGGAGNPAWTGKGAGPRALTDYLWHDVLAKDSFLDILQKFVNYDKTAKQLIFPRYHQLDVVRKIVADVRKNGSGKSYLVQHSAGSGKSNSIAWIAYRLASLFNDENKPVFNSVIVVTDRRVLDKQLQNTITSFDQTLGLVAVINEDKTSKDLLQAIDDGKRIIVSTLQKFPVIFKDVKHIEGKRFAIIVDEAHSSQTGDSAAKMKYALADLQDAIKQYEEETGKKIDSADENDPDVQLALMMCAHGKHKNLSYFAFTATPKDVTLDMFGTRQRGGGFRPFHTYSMRQAIEEGFIHDVLANYCTYKRCTRIVKAIKDNPDVPVSETAKIIQRYKNMHPRNFMDKSAIIASTFLDVTEKKYPGAKMMVVTDARLAAVEYTRYIKEALKARKREDVLVMTAFSGEVEHPKNSGIVYTEESLNRDKRGKPVKETQTKAVFHTDGSILIVAEKYQTGFDEPLLHTMIVDKKLRDVKAVQTLSRVNRTCKNKTDTFILDFVNTEEEIKEAFQPYYQETDLEDEINIDLVFSKLQEIRSAGLYDFNDVDRVCKIHFAANAKDGRASQGEVVSALVEVQRKYNELPPKERALYRRQVRSFVRWYNYLCQITRLFDEETAKEHVFLSYLQHLLPADKDEKMKLEDFVTLEYYKLQETFRGSIALEKKKTELPTPEPKRPSVMEQKKDALQKIIDELNAQSDGDFTEQDRVIMEMVIPLLCENPRLKLAAESQSEQAFMDSIYPKEFNKAMLDAYKLNDEAFKKLMEDKDKVELFGRVLARYTFDEFQRRLAAKNAGTPRKRADAALWASGKADVAAPVPDGYVAVLPLEARWYDEIESGAKRIEYRAVTPRYTTMLVTNKPVAVKLMYGYSKKSMVWGVESVVAKAGNYAIHLGKRYE